LKVCIVGGNGNIGYCVARHLLLLGHEVFCFNRGLTGQVPEGAILIRGDRYDREAFEQTIRQEKFDAAIDMLCFNAQDAQSSVRAFRGVGHFINCSSVATYGREFDTFPANETHPLRPWTDYNRDYALGKAEADESFLDAFRTESFPVTLIKPSITYGPQLGLLRQIGNDLTWIARIRQGKPLVVAGDGTALHQFMHSDDAGRAFALLLGRSKTIGETFNLVSDQPVSWSLYHKVAMQVLGRDVEMVGIPYRILENLMSNGAIQCSDIFWQNHFFSGRKLKALLPEFEPSISLETGIRMVIEVLDRERRIPAVESSAWEDRLIKAQLALSLSPPQRGFWHR
jgi:nucleoside-diphosphate-sugar epimerase